MSSCDHAKMSQYSLRSAIIVSFSADLYNADYENRQKTNNGFYKMDKFYALAQAHFDEIRKLLEEFDYDQLQFAMELEGYEKHILVKHYAILVKVKKYMLHRHHTFNFGYFVD